VYFFVDNSNTQRQAHVPTCGAAFGLQFDSYSSPSGYSTSFDYSPISTFNTTVLCTPRHTLAPKQLPSSFLYANPFILLYADNSDCFNSMPSMATSPLASVDEHVGHFNGSTVSTPLVSIDEHVSQFNGMPRTFLSPLSTVDEHVGHLNGRTASSPPTSVDEHVSHFNSMPRMVPSPPASIDEHVGQCSGMPRAVSSPLSSVDEHVGHFNAGRSQVHPPALTSM
jgi:hypothetical protein